MIRIVKMTGKCYGVKIDGVEQAADEIEMFVDEGTPVLIIGDLDEAYMFDIDPDEVIMVEKD